MVGPGHQGRFQPGLFCDFIFYVWAALHQDSSTQASCTLPKYVNVWFVCFPYLTGPAETTSPMFVLDQQHVLVFLIFSNLFFYIFPKAIIHLEGKGKLIWFYLGNLKIF